MSRPRGSFYEREIAKQMTMLNAILNAPTVKAKKDVVVQYNPFHYILVSEGEHRGLSQ